MHIKKATNYKFKESLLKKQPFEEFISSLKVYEELKKKKNYSKSSLIANKKYYSPNNEKSGSNYY